MTKKPTAFSLIELSIVIVIVAVLLTGTLSFSVNNATNDKIKTTNERIQAIYKAMGIYLANNSKLPCPAALNLDKTNSTYGTAATTCTAAPSSGSGYWKSSDSTNAPNLYYGMVPTKTLGLPSIMAEDGFGTKFSYMTLTGFTSATTFGYGSASVASSKNYANDASTTYRIVIKEKPLATAQTITNDAMFAIISYGPNKSGGWNANSTTQNTVSSDTDEAENDVDSPDSTAGVATFDYTLIASSPNSDVFDDIVFWKTRDQMTLDFDLLSLVACDTAFGGSAPNYGGYNTYAWAASTAVHYGEVSPASTGTCADASYTRGPSYPSKRCGAFGVWEADVIDNCLN